MLNLISGDSMRGAKSILTARRLLITLIAFQVVAESFSQKTDLNLYKERMAGDSPYRFQEKLFIHLDQSSFLTGETVWLKVYLVDRNSNQLSDLSKVAYLELIDKSNEVVFKTKIPVTGGVGNGSIFLPTTLASGNYTVVGYTRWMRNFSTDFYFHQTIKIINPFVKLGNSEATDGPLYDIQFFPEGGNLVAGLKSSVGFRVVGKNGKGIKFKGSLVNSKNDTVATFSPHIFGLGQFDFTPESGQHYRAVIVDSIGTSVNTLLPEALAEGYVTHITEDADFVVLNIKSTLKHSEEDDRPIYLVLQSKNKKIESRKIALSNKGVNFRFDKRKMHEGVNKFILFDQDLKAVCERLFFIKPTDDLKMQIHLDKASYKTREKISLNITPSQNKSLLRTMSVAVYRIDSLELDKPVDISSFLWLTSEVKGNVESPAYYLNHTEDRLAVDNLMLTHGWSKFKKEISANERVQFIPEYGGQLFSGRVVNLDGNPAKGINTFLSVTGKGGRVYMSQSNEDGVINFDVVEFYGEKKIVLQTNPKIDSVYRIEMNNPFAEVSSEFSIPKFEISKKLSGILSSRSLSVQLQSAFSPQSTLQPPTITEVPFYGKPDEKYILDDFTRFPTMEEVMREYVKGVMVRKRKEGFHFLTVNHINNSLFSQNPLVLMDGVPVFDINKIMAFDPRKIQRLDVITQQYYLGRHTFSGVVSYFTYDGSLSDYIPEKAKVFFDEGLQLSREFFSPVYETQQQLDSRTPDRRHLLLWSPEIPINSQGEFNIPFYSSDVAGPYRVVVQGLTIDGKPAVGITDLQVTERNAN